MPDAAQQELDALEASLAARGVEIDAYVSKDPYGRQNLHLSRIVIERGRRGQGLGTRAMEELTSIADRYGLLTTLSPSTDFGGSSVERLKKFYRRFGFVSNKGRRKDFTLQDSMYRRPSAPASMGARHRPEGSEGTAYIDHTGGMWEARWYSRDEGRYVVIAKKGSRQEAVEAARREGFKPVVISPGLEGRKAPWNPRFKELTPQEQALIPIWPEFVDAYLEAALWASSVGDNEKPLDDQGYAIHDFAQSAINEAVEQSNAFILANMRDLTVGGQSRVSRQRHGHDFWLSRNGHGAGFFDRGYGDAGKRLQKAAKIYGESNAYVGNDGKIYFMAG